MNYKEIIKISKDEVSKFNSLLDIEADENKVADMGYAEDTCLYRLSAFFTDGHFADIKICSGQSNFFCDPVLFNKDGYEVCVLDCSDTVDGEYPFEDNGNIYTVVVEVE